MAYDLPAVIRSIPDFSAKTAAECRAYYAEAPTTLKAARYNANDLMIMLGVQVANGLAAALEAAGLKLVVASLATSNGIDFGHETTQAMLTQLGQNQAFAPYVDSLKALGQDTRTRWAREGLTDDLPDLAEFEAAKSTVLREQLQEAMIAKINHAQAVAAAAVHAGAASTVDDVIGAFTAAMEAE